MNNSLIYDRIHKTLSEKKQSNLFRTTAEHTPESFIDLSTNSYLSLHTNMVVAHDSQKLAHNRFFGNLASRLIASHSPLYSVLEAELASWKKTESALLFNSGYSANIGIIQSICTRTTDVFSDKLNHASIIDGIMLSGAHMIRYRHCDMADLKEKLSSSTQKEKMIITDSVFSMDGDRAPLADICDLAQNFSCMVMVDEAHATGIFGKTGSGLIEECELDTNIDIRMGTLSKSIAGLGGFFAGSVELRDFLVNKARSLIYSTALPHAVLAHNVAAIRFVRNHPEMGNRVLSLAKGFRELLCKNGFNTLNSSTQIVPCIVGTEKAALELCEYLKTNGIKVPAIRPPTVAPKTARLRFSIQLDCKEDQLHSVISILNNWKSIHE